MSTSSARHSPETENRQRLREQSQEDQDAARERAREAQAKYRDRHRSELRTAQRTRRQLDYIKKYGQLAYDAKIDKQYQNAEAKKDRMRRARRAGARPKTKRAAQAREKAARRLKGRS
ncbi:hypothetical protein C8R43DRAFT_1137912 [Mycena crocata]|nr:hypothetical protein C8R43DRAFT_1137912 [Mycena crocata]